jgi:hypothetical protein
MCNTHAFRKLDHAKLQGHRALVGANFHQFMEMQKMQGRGVARKIAGQQPQGR